MLFLDEVMVYNRALQEDEIYHLSRPVYQTSVNQVQLRFRHAGGSVWPELAPTGLQFYLSMDSHP